MQPIEQSRAAVVHLNFRAGSTFPVLVCTVSPGHWVNKADTQIGLAGERLTRSGVRAVSPTLQHVNNRVQYLYIVKMAFKSRIYTHFWHLK